MNNIQLSSTARVVVSRVGNENTAQLQHLGKDGWETVYRKVYSSDWKGKITEDIVAAYERSTAPSDFEDVDIDPFNS